MQTRRLLAALLALAPAAALAQDADRLLQQSLPLRTALHNDPTLQAPLDALVTLYRGANRIDELVAIYRNHTSQFPEDIGAQVVYLRLLAALGDPTATAATRTVAELLPDVPYVQYLLSRALAGEQDVRALDVLDAAIEKETDEPRKRAWILELLPAAQAEARVDLLEKHLRTLGTLAGTSPDAALAAARLMTQHGQPAMAAELIDRVGTTDAAPEQMVEMQMAAADAEVAGGARAAASRRLGALLDRLAADYWRRPEILRRRLALVEDEAERQAMVADARARLDARPNDEHAALALADVLAGFDRRREAIDVLLRASERAPHSQRLEAAVRESLDALRDERARERYLKQRLEAQPDREDLMLARSRALFLLGEPDEAIALLVAGTQGLPQGAALSQRLEMARFLRRSSLPADAARVLDRVVADEPARLDMRRELAELRLALEQRDAALAALEAPIPPDAAIENFLDLANFMIAEELFRPARAALESRMAREPANIDVPLLLAKAHAGLGQAATGAELIDRTRALADTPARYRSWIEAAVDFHEGFETADAFLEAESARLAGERGWEPAKLERRFAFVEVANRTRHGDAAAKLLREDLAAEPPADAAVELRRRLVAVLGGDLEAGEALEAELQKLAADIPDATHEVNARLALLYMRQQRHDLLQPLLQLIDPGKIADATLLRSVEQLFSQHGQAEKSFVSTERLLQMNPADRSLWQRWLTLLAAGGDEPRLRAAIRRLLAGVDKMPLAEDTLDTLRAQLVESYWRSIALRLADADEAGYADALHMLDEAQRVVRDDARATWTLWSRAYALHRLGRAAERDEAIAELERVARDTDAAGRRKAAQLVALRPPATPPGDPSGAPPAAAAATPEPVVVFPDGLQTPVSQVRMLLTSSPPPAVDVALANRSGPAAGGKLAARWAYDAPGGAAITWVQPYDGALLVADLTGRLTSLDPATGKLRWSRGEVLPATPTSGTQMMIPYPGGGYQPLDIPMRALRPILGEDGRLYVAGGDSVRCISASDGRVLWEAASRPWDAPSVRTLGMHLSPALEGGALLAFDPVRHALLRFDRDTGKLLREQPLPGKREAQPNAGGWRDSGVSIEGGRMLVYGSGASIIDLETGLPLWSFDPPPEGRFPIKLDAPDDPSGGGSAGPAISASPASFGYGRMGMPNFAPSVAYFSYMQAQRGMHFNPGQLPPGGVAFTAPPVAWAGETNTQRLGMLHRGRLVLMSQNSGSLSLPLDLPLRGVPLPANGTYVGSLGDKLVFLAGYAIFVVDATTGEQRHIPLEEVADPQDNRVGAALDGNAIYVTGPKGVVALHAISGKRLFRADWPEAVKPAATPAAQANNPMGGGMRRQVNYLWHGRTEYVQTWGPYGGGGGGYGPCLPLVDRVHDGVLYATPEPWRLVALEEPKQ